MERKYLKLDNPAWYSLCEDHAKFGIGSETTKFYDSRYCKFGAIHKDVIIDIPTEYSSLEGSFYIIGNNPKADYKLQINKELVCSQMVLEKPIDISPTYEIVELQVSDYEALFEIVNLVQPGYFQKDTPLLGRYYGIFEDEILVSVAGERMKMNDFTEISAVVTRPGYTGKGFAKKLIAHCAKVIFAGHKTPYLHVLESNQHAIDLYKYLGFETRRSISFWQCFVTQ